MCCVYLLWYRFCLLISHDIFQLLWDPKEFWLSQLYEFFQVHHKIPFWRPNWLCPQRDKILAVCFQPHHQLCYQNWLQFCLGFLEIWMNCPSNFSKLWVEKLLTGQFHLHVCYLYKYNLKTFNWIYTNNSTYALYPDYLGSIIKISAMYYT